MKRAYLIARQEFIKYVTRRGFLISVLLFPLWIGLVAFLPHAGSRHAVARVHGRGSCGRLRGAIAEAVARADARAMLSALADYATSQCGYGRSAQAGAARGRDAG